MKRYRIYQVNFDARVRVFDQIQDHWEDRVKQLWYENRQKVVAGLIEEFGERDFERKLEDFKSIESAPFSVVAFHNKFFAQIRYAFVHGQYFPALTAVCALGERVLNHLVIGLRDEYRSHLNYKLVYRKSSFDDWSKAIEFLNTWGVLTEDAVTHFKVLAQKRNAAIHFNPETEVNDRELALEAIRVFGKIISSQFSAHGDLPWLLQGRGETFIAKDWEKNPFVRLVYIPRSRLLGYKHSVESIHPWVFCDAEDYEDREVSDEEFLRLREQFKINGCR